MNYYTNNLTIIKSKPVLETLLKGLNSTQKELIHEYQLLSIKNSNLTDVFDVLLKGKELTDYLDQIECVQQLIDDIGYEIEILNEKEYEYVSSFEDKKLPNNNEQDNVSLFGEENIEKSCCTKVCKKCNCKREN